MLQVFAFNALGGCDDLTYKLFTEGYEVKKAAGDVPEWELIHEKLNFYSELSATIQRGNYDMFAVAIGADATAAPPPEVDERAR